MTPNEHTAALAMGLRVERGMTGSVVWYGVLTDGFLVETVDDGRCYGHEWEADLDELAPDLTDLATYLLAREQFIERAAADCGSKHHCYAYHEHWQPPERRLAALLRETAPTTGGPEA